MNLSPLEKMAHISMTLIVCLAYVAMAWWKLEKPRNMVQWRSSIWSFLRIREPSIRLDSAVWGAFVLWLLFTKILPPLSWLETMLDHNLALAKPEGIFWFLPLAWIHPQLLWLIAALFYIGFAARFLGFFPRLGAGIAGLSHTLLWSCYMSFAHTSHSNLCVSLILLTLALAPHPGPTLIEYCRQAIAGKSLIETGSYPLVFRLAVMFPVATAYYQSGVEKLIRSGLYWTNGITLQGHLLRLGNSFGHEIATWSIWILVIASIVALVWELSGFLVLFQKWVRPIYTVCALGFHNGTYMAMNIAFIPLQVSLLFLFSPVEWVEFIAKGTTSLCESWGESPVRSSIHSIPASFRIAFLPLIVLATLQWVPTAARGGVYPFLTYDMFNGHYKGGEILPRDILLYAEKISGWQIVNPKTAFGFSKGHFVEDSYYRFASSHPRHKKLRKSATVFCNEYLSKLNTDTIAFVLIYYEAGSSALRKREIYRCGKNHEPLKLQNL